MAEPQLTESDVAKIEARAKKYRDLARRAATPADEEVIRWLAKTVAALIRDWRALRQIVEIQSRESDGDLTTIQKALAENAALRERLAQAESDRDYWKERVFRVNKGLQP